MTHYLVYTNEKGLPVAFDEFFPGPGLQGGVTAVRRKTLEEMRSELGDSVRVMTRMEYLAEEERSRTTGPIPIDYAAWMYALEVLPPEKWQHGGGAQSFRLAEAICGVISRFFVCIGNDESAQRFYSLDRHRNTTHAELTRLCIEYEREHAADALAA